MNASSLIGRVGGLAAALGVGTALFIGCGAAGAETESDAPGTAAPKTNSGPLASPSVGAGSSGSAVPTKKIPARKIPATRRAASATASTPSGTVSAGSAHRAPEAIPGPASPVSGRSAVYIPARTAPPAASRPLLPVATVAPRIAPAPAIAPSLANIVDGVSAGSSNSASEPANPLEWTGLALARREPADFGNAIAALAPRGAQIWSEKGITVTVGVDTTDGLVAGIYDATTTRADSVLVITPLGGSAGGKMSLGTLPGIRQSFTALPYATWLDPGGIRGTEQFRLGVREYTQFDQFVIGIPLIGTPLIHFLQDTPLIRDLLAPLVGHSVTSTFNVDVAALAPGDVPVAYTYKVTSFDGTEISTNFFPASKLVVGATAPTAVIAPGFGFAGSTNPFALYALKDEVPGVFTMRNSGYNVVTYDPRGRFSSGGEVHLANPDFEGKDVSSLIDFIAARTPAQTNGPNDPKVGLLGGSYGAALQFAAAADQRIDAMVPVDGWDSLVESFYPGRTFKTGYGALTVLSLITTGSRVFPPLYAALGSGLLLNWVGPWGRDLLSESDPPLAELTAPTLLIRGTADVLFPLQQGTANARAILARGDVPLKMLWFCGGHGVCNNPYGPDQPAAMLSYTLAWMTQYVKQQGTAADAIPVFEWFDQRGARFNSSALPFQEAFNDLPDVMATDRGDVLGLVPVLGGSGGLSIESLINGSEARNAINVTVPTDKLVAGTQVVGSPAVEFTYRGLGASGAVYAQVLDTATGLVLGNIVTPIPVTLDGRSRVVRVEIGEIAYTVGESDSLVVQITSSATSFLRALAFGVVDISDITVTIPNRTTPAQPSPAADF